jgi:hypothetical protein
MTKINNIMSISFPSGPATNQIYTYNGKSWKWNGTNWAANTVSAGSGGSSLTFGSVQTSNFTASSNYIYPVNTTSGAITATLPASPTAGDQILFVDYASNWTTNIFTVDFNGQKYRGVTASTGYVVNSNYNFNLIYVDSTKGWLSVPVNMIDTSYTVSVLVIAGGGSGGGNSLSGGGGAGGLTTATMTLTPLNNYTVTVGAGASTAPNGTAGTTGSNSVFNGTTAYGGGGGGVDGGGNGQSGGSGGGAGRGGTGGGRVSGQGYVGASSTGSGTGGGGGAGQAGIYTGGGGTGGAGASNSITGSAVTYAGGGGGGGWGAVYGYGAGGAGGGGNGGYGAGTAGTANTGGGGGGGGYDGGNGAIGGAGGSGTVIISYPNPTQRGSGGTVTNYNNSGTTYWVHSFTTSGTYTS